jgi:hypothetical protein
MKRTEETSFYRVSLDPCWHNVGTSHLFDKFYLWQLDVQRLITLVPKFMEPYKTQQFCHMCLIRWIYKLNTNTLFLRLDPYASKLFRMYKNTLIRTSKLFSMYNNN